MLVPGRHGSSNDYRYGFQGWEKDDEIIGSGNHLSFGDYGYDPRTGRRWNIDPLTKKYPDLTPYHFTGNNPIRFVDFDGEDFGVKINHTDKTIVIVANVYTTSSKAYKQAMKSAGVWNAKSATVDGYTVSFQVKVQEVSVTVTDAQAVKHDPSIVKKNGNYIQDRLSTAKNKLVNAMALGKVGLDDVGNFYAGNNGKYSESVSGESFVGGVTLNGVYINMNTHSELGDIGGQKDPVTHEFGHLFGLDDEGGDYFSEDGIMKYKGLDMNPISDNDVKDILNFAKNALDGKTKLTDSKVKILENTGVSDGSNPIGVKGKKDD